MKLSRMCTNLYATFSCLKANLYPIEFTYNFKAIDQECTILCHYIFIYINNKTILYF